ncbi:MAG: dihydroneopterin aldolase family protein [Promethearchaeia archaeon]
MAKKKDNLYFSDKINLRERACFEAGIKLGALYHILCGIPISADTGVIESIEKGIEAAIGCQPYVKSIDVTLDRDTIIGEKRHEFDYDEITGKVISASLEIEYEDVYLKARVKWVEELDYPLMYIEEIKDL